MRLRKQKATGEKTIYTDVPWIEEGWIWVLQRTELERVRMSAGLWLRSKTSCMVLQKFYHT